MTDYQSELFDDEEINKPVIKQPANRIITFGQYKGQPVEVLAQYPKYVEYLMKDNWLKNNHPYIYQIVINNFYEPNDTPEHNALQVRFLKNDFCFSLGLLCRWKLMKKVNCIRNIDNAIRKINNMPDTYNYGYSQKWKDIEELKSHKEYINETVFEENGIEYIIDGDCPLFEIEKLFEEDGWDVIIQSKSYACEDCLAYKDCHINTNKIAIEIKPTLGDKYPDYLRQMKNARTHPDFQCLIYDNFNATTVTLEQIKETFSLSGFKVFSFAEIEHTMRLLIDNKENYNQKVD
jgi:hypothetical protein